MHHSKSALLDSHRGGVVFQQNSNPTIDKCSFRFFQIILISLAINTDSKHSRYKEPLQYERQRSVTVMSEKLSLVTCTSCGKPIPPGSESTKFLCPNCGEIQIKRDGKCRKFGRLYKCPKCGFSGP